MAFKVVTYSIIAFLLLIAIVGTNDLFAEEYLLEDLYRIALERAETIKLSEEDLYIAERGKDKALSLLLPKLSTFWDYTRYSEKKTSPLGFLIQPEYTTTWGLRLDQSLSLSGKELTALRISKENINKSEYDLYAVREDYLFSVASSYYDVLKAKKALEIAKANVQRLKKHRDAAAIRLSVGAVTKTDLLRAEAELSGSQSELISAENNLKLAKAVLARTVGLSGDFEVKESAHNHQLSDVNILIGDCQLPMIDCLKQIAIKERAELKSMTLQKKITQDKVKFARGAYWPTLSVEGVYERRKEEPESPFLPRENIFGVLNINFPFFEGGLRRAEVREAKAKQRKSELIYEDLKKMITVEVDDAYLDFQTQKGVLKSFEDQVTFARDNYNAILKQFEFGLVNSVDVMDANTLLVTSERQLTDARYSSRLAILRLKWATGTLLKTIINQNTREE